MDRISPVNLAKSEDTPLNRASAKAELTFAPLLALLMA